MKNKLKRKIIKKILPTLLPILTTILMSVLIFFIYYWIEETIVDIVDKFFQEIHDMFADFGGWVNQKWATFKNWLASGGLEIKFDPNEYETNRLDPEKIINDANVKEMMDKLDEGIVTKTAGLDETMIKKMMLANFRDLYLDDTTVLIEMSNEDFGISESEWNGYFKKWQEKDSDLAARMLVQAGKYARQGFNYGRLFGKWGTIIGTVGGSALGAIVGYAETPYINRCVMYEDKLNILRANFDESLQPFELVAGCISEPREEFKDGIEEIPIGGIDGAVYLKTKGTITILAGCEGCRDGLDLNCTYNTDSREDTFCTNSRLIYYAPETLDEIYNEHYKDLVGIGGYNQIYVNSVKDYLKRCYTYEAINAYDEPIFDTNAEAGLQLKTDKDGNLIKDTDGNLMYVRITKKRDENGNIVLDENGDIIYIEEDVSSSEFNNINKEFTNSFTGAEDVIKMYTKTEKRGVITWTWKYDLELAGVTENATSYGTGSTPVRNLATEALNLVGPQYIHYTNETSEYGTPLEFLIMLLEITNSKDFVNSFIERIGNENTIILQLYERDQRNIDFIQNDSFRIVSLVGTKDRFIISKFVDTPESGMESFFGVNNVEIMPGASLQEIKQTGTILTQYDIRVKRVHTWYADIEYDNTLNYLYYVSMGGDVKINNQTSPITSQQNIQLWSDWNDYVTDNQAEALKKATKTPEEGDETYTMPSISKDIKPATFIGTYTVYTKDEYPWIFGIEGTGWESHLRALSWTHYKEFYKQLDSNPEMQLTEDELLRIQFLLAHVNQTNVENRDHEVKTGNEWQRLELFDTMESTSIAEYTVNLQLNQNSTLTWIENYSSFLGLLCNATGSEGYQYFVPEGSGGKKVTYKDLDGNDIPVIDYLINAEQMVYDLLSRFENTQGLVKVMKAAFSCYKNGDYSPQTFNYNIFEKEFETVNEAA